MAARRRTPTSGDLSLLEDGDLVHALRDWSDAALEEIYRRHVAAVLRLARTVIYDREVAEEVVQELFLRLWDAPERFTPSRGTLRGFLLTDCRSRCIDRLRSDAARRAREERSDRESGAAEADGPELRTLATLESADLQEALLRLPPEEGRAIALAFFGGHSYTSVAALLGAPEGTVKSRIRAGLRRLHDDLAG